MSPSGWVSYFDDAGTRLINMASRRLDAVIPSCPAWVGRDLVAHFGTRPAVWSVLMSTEPGSGFPPPNLERLQELSESFPHDDEALIPWAHDNVSSYVGQLRGVDPGTPAWSYTPDETTGFWMRRAALEAAVHLWDAEGLHGDHGVVPTALAADGLDELVDTYPVQLAMGGAAEVTALVVRATDARRAWRLSPAGSSVGVAGGVRGTASDLFLFLWGRKTGSFRGDVGLLDDWAALQRIG